jgi:DNA-directed RNA polymerase specialized sigma24 family protein
MLLGLDGSLRNSSKKTRRATLVKNTSDVDDLVQDTFLKAWLHLSKFRFEASFRTWITRVALN